MPSLGADMDAGKISRWLVKPGDPVKRGDIVAVVETAKADIDAEIFEDGVIDAILVHEGEEVPVGTVLATIRSEVPPDAPREEAPAPAGVLRGVAAPGPIREEPTPIQAEPPAPAGPSAPPPRPASPVVRRLATRLHVDLDRVKGTGPGGEIHRVDVERAASPVERVPSVAPPARPSGARSSPLARRRAAELHVDLSTAHGTGPGGAITESDVLAAAHRAPAEPHPAAGAVERVEAEPSARAPAADKQQAMRLAIANLMARSKREIPHYYLETHVDMTAALNWLEAENAKRSVRDRILYAALLIKATALAVAEVPEMNGFWVDGAFRPGGGVHVGVATSLRQGGLVAPALHDVDTRSLDEVMAGLRDLVTRTRAGRLKGSEMADPTITVTNLGEQGVEAVHGVIYVPQVALVGFGRIVRQPRAVDGLLGVRPVIKATLAADHRASDGHRGGLFLNAIDRLLQGPEEL